jgi:hypothetical protein
MRLPTPIVAIVLLAVAAAGYSQVPSPPVPELIRPTFIPEGRPLLARPTLEQSAAPQEQTVEQMLDAVDALRVQKAVLEKQEKAIIEQLSKKVEKQSERMRKLGIGLPKPVESPDPLGIPSPLPTRPNLPD